MSTHTSQHGSVVRVGVVGLGFMGRTHARAVLAAERDGLPCHLVAMCDHKASGLDNAIATFRGDSESSGNLNTGAALTADAARLAALKQTTNLDDVLSDDLIDLVVVATPTDTHTKVATAALRAGKHVMIEKPVALSLGDVESLKKTAASMGRRCIPAMCMRYWPGWSWLHDRIRDKSFGELRSLSLERAGARPTWNPFYADVNRCGGALFDLHIHDTDYIVWCLGRPDSVSSVGDPVQRNHVVTQYRWNDDRVSPDAVSASGSWRLASAAGFIMRFTAIFDDATAEFALSQDAAHPHGRVRLSDSKIQSDIVLPTIGGYDQQMRHTVEVLAGKKRDDLPTMTDSEAATKVLLAELQSMKSGKIVDVPA